ncbi:MAG: alanine racemase [Desulfovibrio sp.]|nr:alanine racemase [Desulfovibrio sp.]
MNDCTFTPSRCHIDLSALVRNFARMGEPARLMPVIKSDAYGHGLMPVAHALDKAGACRFAVGTVSEAAALRREGFPQFIVPLLGALGEDEWRAAYANRIAAPIRCREDLAMAAAACPEGRTFDVVISLETGMGRLGFSRKEVPALIEALRTRPRLKPVLALSHMACADIPDETDYTTAQQESFARVTEALREAFPQMSRSLNNSAGTMRLPDTAFEICRPGISLYGGNPFTGTEWEDEGDELEWVMSVSAPVLQVRRLKPGQSISYGRIFTAPVEMTIAVVAAGYATGLTRALSNNCDMLVNGRRCPQIGRICMGMSMVDVSAIGHVEAGDTAWIIGGEPQPGQRAVTAQEIAESLGTISYEVLCLMGSTNPRVYH